MGRQGQLEMGFLRLSVQSDGEQSPSEGGLDIGIGWQEDAISLDAGVFGVVRDPENLERISRFHGVQVDVVSRF